MQIIVDWTLVYGNNQAVCQTAKRLALTAQAPDPLSAA